MTQRIDESLKKDSLGRPQIGWKYLISLKGKGTSSAILQQLSQWNLLRNKFRNQ
jgi:hypothetical protein